MSTLIKKELRENFKVALIGLVVFTFMLAGFPAGLVIYWAWNNSLSIAQQWLIMYRMGVKVN